MTETATSECDPKYCPRSITVVEHILILAATGLIFAAILSAAPLQSANDRSRWATVWSLVERGTFQIDDIDQYARWSTIDKVRYRSDESTPWHFYSSKPPLLSVIVAGLYAIERWTLGHGLFHETQFVTRLLLLIVNGLPFWLALIALCRCLLMLGASLPARLFVLAVAGFGSMLNPYLTTLNNHTPAAACAMFAVTAAVELLTRRQQGSPAVAIEKLSARPFANLGVFAALTCCFELPAALMGMLSFVLAAAIDRRRTLTHFVPAAVIPLAAFFVTNWLATGGIKPFYASYGSETYVYEHNGIPSYWTNPRDLDANQESPAVYLFHCVLGHHGLLSLTPVLCLSVCGWGFMVRRKGDLALRSTILTGAVLTTVTLGFYLTRTQNYNYGGNSVGLRWMLWLSPFWWIAMAPAVEKLKSRWSRNLAGLLLLVSVTSVSWSLHSPWRPSWLYEQMQASGWIQYRTSPEPFSTPRSSIFGHMPTARGTMMQWKSSDGELLTIKVSDQQPTEGVLRYNVTFGDSAAELFGFELDLPSWTARGEVADHRPGSNAITHFEKLASGFPDAVGSREEQVIRRVFNPAGPLWVPSASDPARAWKTERGAARVVAEDPVFGECSYRCDVLYCDQLPFGVLQWKLQTSLNSTGEIIKTKTWIAVQR